MLKRQEIEDPNSCLNKAADQEPIFVLRANDELAADMVRTWANKYADSKLRTQPKGAMTEAQTQKYRSAMALADSMDRYSRQRRIPHS